MTYHLENAGAMLAASSELGREKLKQLLILALLAIALTGCGVPTSRDVRAYNTCAGRHPRELALCEGPRQAYELNPTALEARAAAIGPAAGSSTRQLSPAPSLAPVPLHPSSITSGRNG
jgi:hypothetical protein